MDIDVYLPIFTILQFFFYMGLLKVRWLSQQHGRMDTFIVWKGPDNI